MSQVHLPDHGVRAVGCPFSVAISQYRMGVHYSIIASFDASGHGYILPYDNIALAILYTCAK
jgi:hypothetical protein